MHASSVDATATREGLALRVAPEVLAPWTIRVREQPDASFRVELAQGGAVVVVRTIVLTTSGVEDRSRELAAALALVVERATPPVGPPSQAVPPSPRESRAALRFAVGAGPRFALGAEPALDAELGVAASFATYLVADHLRLDVGLGWGRSREGSLTLDGLGLGPGLSGGAPLGHGFWLGGGVGVRALWVVASDVGTQSTFSARPRLGVSVDYRGRGVGRESAGQGLWCSLGLHALFTQPAIAAGGAGADVRWGPARFGISVVVGYVWAKR